MTTANHSYPDDPIQDDATLNQYDAQEAANDLNEIRAADDLQEPDPEGEYEPTTPGNNGSGENDIIDQQE